MEDVDLASAVVAAGIVPFEEVAAAAAAASSDEPEPASGTAAVVEYLAAASRD